MSLSGEGRSPKSVFVVVANRPTRALIGSFFHNHGISVIEASSADEAQSVLGDRQDAVNFVIADLVLGQKSGPELIRALFGEASTIPRVFLFDPWSFVPPHLRSRFPAEELIEMPVSHRKLAQVLNGRLPGLKGRGSSDPFAQTPATVGT